ncbi:MAG: ABC transporter permease [Alphaproteobacteria bacterium]|nr:ABC transporter permease [Alphaproteobacteria bacterium]
MHRLTAAIYPLAAMIGVIALWYATVIFFAVPKYILPLPGDVYQRIREDLEFLLWHSLITVLETLGGFALSIALGIPIAIALVASRTLDRALMPWLILSQTFPKVALAPLIVVWFGLGFTPKLLVTFLVAFFPIVISTIVGLRSIEREMIELAQSMRATTLQMFWHFRLPLALPNIFAGLKVSVAFAVVGAVIAEWVGASAGLGYLLMRANGNLDTTLLFAVLAALMVIGVFLYYAVEVIERLSIPWHVVVRLQDMARGA